MSKPYPPRPRAPRVTTPLRDFVIDDHESTHRAPRTGDWILLGFLVVVLLGNGIYVWRRLAPTNDHLGRAIFFGVLLFCVLWAAIVYIVKLSVSARVGPHGVSIVRGPWRTELPWRDVTRLVERTQTGKGQRFRWVVVMARDGRRLQVREDMVADYPRFRLEVFERYRLYRDHGGTWGAMGGGPFTSREFLSGQVTWWACAAVLLALPGLYFAFVVPETGWVGPALLALAALCFGLSLRSALRRQTYTVDAKAITAHRVGRTVRLAWRDVARVDRSRHRVGAFMVAAITAGRVVLKLVARGDARVQSFDWYPRVPEYLVLRGLGRHVRIALHRVPRPDDLLAWIEFYEGAARHAAARDQGRRTAPPATIAPDESETGSAAPAEAFAQGLDPAFLAADGPAGGDPGASADAWLRAEPDEDSEDTAHLEAVSHQTVAPERASAPETHRKAPTGAPSPAVEPAPHTYPDSPDLAWAASTPASHRTSGPLDRSAEAGSAPSLEPESDPQEEQPTAPLNLAESFAFWRQERPSRAPKPPPKKAQAREPDSLQRPILPRYGPPVEPSERREDDGTAFAPDEFLR